MDEHESADSQVEWINVDEALPTIIDGDDSVNVYVKLAGTETPVKGLYLRKIGTLSYPGSGFALAEVPTKDINNRTIQLGSSSPLEPTHWRLRHI